MVGEKNHRGQFLLSYLCSRCCRWRHRLLREVRVNRGNQSNTTPFAKRKRQINYTIKKTKLQLKKPMVFQRHYHHPIFCPLFCCDFHDDERKFPVSKPVRPVSSQGASSLVRQSPFHASGLPIRGVKGCKPERWMET